MKLSNQVIINIINGIGAITTKSMPVKASYAISKNLAKLDSEGKLYSLEREKMLNKYAEKDEEGKFLTTEDGMNIRIKPEFVVDWNRDLQELLSIEVEVDVHKFSIEYLSNVEMSVQELGLIEFMIEE